MRNLSRDVREGWRRLRATPLFTIFAVLTVALGIGITTAIYAAARDVLSPPAGVEQPERVLRLTRTRSGGGPLTMISWPEFDEFRAQQSSFEKLAAWTFIRGNVAAGNRADSSWIELVSGDYFGALGVRPEVGRLIQSTDDRSDVAPVAVISDRAWRRWFDRTPNVVGRALRVNGQVVVIAGVASPPFSGLFNGGVVPTDVWLPLTTASTQVEPGGAFDPGNASRNWLFVFGRLGAGHSVEEARAETIGISTDLNARYQNVQLTRAGKHAAPPWVAATFNEFPKLLNTDAIIGPMTTTLMAAVVLVLLVACTNLSNLMLARAGRRRGELAVRLALGASRWRLARETVMECALLASAGGIAGIMVARLLVIALGTELVINRGASLRLQPQIDAAVLAVSFVATFLALFVSAAAPAWYACRLSTHALLATNAGAVASSRWRRRRALIVAQVAVSALLVVIAAFAVAQVVGRASVDRGVDFGHLALVEVDFSAQRYDEASARRIADAVLERTTTMPQVVSASISSGLPVLIGTPGALLKGPSGALNAAFVSASSRVLETLNVRLRRGRGFDARDTASTEPVAVIGEFTARYLFGTDDVVGRSIEVTRRPRAGELRPSVESRTIVGVVPQVDRDSAIRGLVYVPLAQAYEGDLVFAVRSETDPAAAVTGMLRALRDIDPDLAVTQALTGSTLLGQETLFFQVVAGIASVLGWLALVVALAGLSGVLSFLVAGRTREIGIRIAIGADARAIRRSVLREGLRPVVFGLVIGISVGLIARMGLRSFFTHDVPALDVVALLAVPALFVVTAIAAAYWPALRASRVDPTVALRQT